MNRPVLILMSGGRGEWPNIWSVLAFRPSHVYIVPPEGGGRGAQTVAAWLTLRRIPHEILPSINAYDAVTAKAVCEEVFARHPEQPILINLTQAPKMLAIGASFAAFSESLTGRADICAFHRETSTDTSHTAFGVLPAPLPHRLTVDDYLCAYGFSGQATFFPTLYSCSEAALGDLAAQFARHSDAFLALIAPIHSRASVKKGTEALAISESVWREDWLPLLTALEASELVTDLAVFPGNRRFRFTSRASWDFLNGKWLEMYALDAASRAVDPATGALIFDDCRQGVMIIMEHTRVEIDLACVDRAGMFLYGSCKTSNELKSEMLTEISDRASLLGGSYCAKVLVTTCPRVMIKAAFLNQARERNIAVISGEELPQLAARFGAVMAAARRAAR